MNEIKLNENGILFPSWITHTFKKYRLPEIIKQGDDHDPCEDTIKKELHKYQKFIADYINSTQNYNSILVYHGLGSGKTATAINIINVFTSADKSANVFILIKASLKNEPWLEQMKQLIIRDNFEHLLDFDKISRMKNVNFIHYDSPFADRDFTETLKKVDNTKPFLFIIDESHNFINNVYSNLENEGKRSLVIYNYLQNRIKINAKETKIVLLSGTPLINKPYELALLFNLLRPNIFPSNEQDFNDLFLTKTEPKILNPETKNMFKRRILGLVSYYESIDPKLFAQKIIKNIELPMTKYHMEIYNKYERIEYEYSLKSKDNKIFKSYTRQASNFVFPFIDSNTTGEGRPRPSQYKLSINDGNKMDEGKEITENDETKIAKTNYLNAINSYLVKLEKYFVDINIDDKNLNHTISNDIIEFVKNKLKFEDDFLKYYQETTKKSKLLQTMYELSPKMTAIIMLSFISPGKILIYSNYVKMEGIDILKIYLKMVGYSNYNDENTKDFFSFGEFHGGINKEEKNKIRNIYNDKNNQKGEKIKIILFSPSGAEGKNLELVRQVHLLEPHWTETRIEQVIGRAVRQCSHKQLPQSERYVNIYRYKVVKNKDFITNFENKLTTDQIIELLAMTKYERNMSFFKALKETAVDCLLFKNHNMLNTTYNCFQFEHQLLFDNSKPAYKQDIKLDQNYDIGIDSKNSKIVQKKVYKIKAKIKTNDILSDVDDYWLDYDTGIVYDFELKYPFGKINKIDKYFEKIDNEDIYIITKTII